MVRGALQGPTIDVTLESAQELGRDGNIAETGTLAEHPKVRLPAGADDVPRPELGQLVEPQLAVAKDP